MNSMKSFSQPRKIAANASRLISIKTKRGFSIKVLKPESDSLAMLLEDYRKKFIAAVKEGNLGEARELLPQIRSALFKTVLSSGELSLFNPRMHLRSDEGIDAIVLASANRDPKMVRFLRQNFLGITSKSNTALYSLALRSISQSP